MHAVTAALIFCLAVVSSQAFAFGADGHRIVSKIAENHLSVKTTAAINAITNGGDLAELSLWPDRVRYIPTWKQSKYWHYISIDDQEQFANLRRHSDGDVLSALEYFYADLQNSQLDRKQQLEALAFFAHFVADIHQPLHVGRRDDLGGNKLAINWLKTPRATNLHKVWDSLIIDTENKNSDQYSQMLDRASKAQIDRWQGSQFIDWARESKALRYQVYNFNSAAERRYPLIGSAYISRNKPIIERRLLMAGIRLADSLNRIFDPEYGGPT
ncbi:MAG: S1/P1 nuclease [Porticoccaceae bacterium]|nr:S1/P1 nuclease [Porticoccaceae bacterium]